MFEILVTLFSFGGPNAYDRAGWRQVFHEMEYRYEEELGVDFKIENHWHKRENRCRKYFKYESERTYGNCIIRRHALKRVKRFGHSGPVLILTPGIPLSGTQTGIAGLASGVCEPTNGAALVHGKQKSDHLLKNGTNPGFEMTVTAMAHELGHLIGAQHDDDTSAKNVGVMESDALWYIVNEWPIAKPWLRFTAVSERAIERCLG